MTENCVRIKTKIMFIWATPNFPFSVTQWFCRQSFRGIWALRCWVKVWKPFSHWFRKDFPSGRGRNRTWKFTQRFLRLVFLAISCCGPPSAEPHEEEGLKRRKRRRKDSGIVNGGEGWKMEASPSSFSSAPRIQLSKWKGGTARREEEVTVGGCLLFCDSCV